jgi:hypothetical protein
MGEWGRDTTSRSSSHPVLSLPTCPGPGDVVASEAGRRTAVRRGHGGLRYMFVNGNGKWSAYTEKEGIT